MNNCLHFRSSSSNSINIKKHKLHHFGYTFNESRFKDSVRGVIKMYIDKINCNNKVFEAIKPLRIEFTKEEDMIISSIPELNINSYGENNEDAKENLFEKVAFLWTEYVECPETQLSYDALELKNKLLSALRKM